MWTSGDVKLNSVGSRLACWNPGSGVDSFSLADIIIYIHCSHITIDEHTLRGTHFLEAQRAGWRTDNQRSFVPKVAHLDAARLAWHADGAWKFGHSSGLCSVHYSQAPMKCLMITCHSLYRWSSRRSSL